MNSKVSLLIYSTSEHTTVSLPNNLTPFIQDILVSAEEVVTPKLLLNKLHPPSLLKTCKELDSLFAHLFQQWIDTGEWSLANICPLSKKKKKQVFLTWNYQPVSLTCVPFKLLKHIVWSNIMANLD